MAEITTPGFTGTVPSEPYENDRDESGILTDQDQTVPNPDQLAADDNMGAISNSLEPLEDEPADFMRGEVDVLDQMNRAADAMDSAIRGLGTPQGEEDSPRSELGAAFKDTPGGLEEVEMKTDEDLARHRVRHHGQQAVQHGDHDQKKH